MKVLEEILKEIEERVNIVENIPVNEDDFLDGEECYEDGRVQGRYEELIWCRSTICSHMDDGKDTDGGWIPVEDGLPEDGEKVLVWYEYFRYGEYNCMFQTHGIGWQYDGFWSGDVSGTKARCIAWQPLPKPYKAKKDLPAAGTEHIMNRFMKVE